MNPFARRIGIWFDDLNWVTRIFDKILENIPYEAIRFYSHLRNDMRIELKDGTVIRFVRASENSRGYAFSESYIQYNTDVQIIDMIIRPCTKVHPYNCYIVSEYDDFYRPKTIEEYYESLGE